MREKLAIDGCASRAFSRKIFRAATPPAEIRAFSSGGERFPDTEEVASSNLATPTTKDQVRAGML